MAGQGEAPPIKLTPIDPSISNTGFCCGAKSVNDYLRKEAWDKHESGQHRVTYASLPNGAAVCGYYSLAAATEELGKLPGRYHIFGGGNHFACMQLVWLGVDSTLQRNGIGKALVGRVIETFASVGVQIGLPHLILVPIDDDIKDFYGSFGFQEYDGGNKMFLPLQTAIEATA